MPARRERIPSAACFLSAPIWILLMPARTLRIRSLFSDSSEFLAEKFILSRDFLFRSVAVIGCFFSTALPLVRLAIGRCSGSTSKVLTVKIRTNHEKLTFSDPLIDNHAVYQFSIRANSIMYILIVVFSPIIIVDAPAHRSIVPIVNGVAGMLDKNNGSPADT